jgi:tRNA(Ile)-lysidine synthase
MKAGQKNMDLLLQVRAAIEKHGMILPGEKVLVGVSGGPDSLTLLHVLNLLKKDMQFELHAAHLDHSFRGREAEEEARWVKETARGWGIDCTVRKIDVPALAEKKGLSPQEAGHRARKEFFCALASRLAARKIALGHQANDQAETILMHFLTGAGPEGLTGIRPCNFPFIRPLIYIPRNEIESYCRMYNLNPRRDPSNQKDVYLRNKLRNKIIPFLESEVNSNLVETLNRTAQVFYAEEEYWQDFIDRTAAKLCVYDNGLARLSLQEWDAMHCAVQRRLLRHIYQLIRKGQGLAFFHVEEVRKLASFGQPGKALDLPDGVKVERTYDCLVFSHKSYSPTVPVHTFPARKLRIPGITSIPEKNLQISAFLVNELKDLPDLSSAAAVPYFERIPELWARPRLPGDRFCPKGLKGTKKLKDWFIDKKVPRSLRDQVLLVADNDEILWIPGMAISDKACRIQEAPTYVLLKAEPLQERNKIRP